MSFKSPSAPALSEIRPERHRSGSLSLHPYFGKVDPALAAALIDQYSRPGDLVLDPFCGSGTVLHAALMAGRSGLGWDSSPLALLIATAKLLGLESDEEESLLAIGHEVQRFGKRAQLFREVIPDGGDIPHMPRVRDVESWFQPNALKELAFLRSYLVSREHLQPPAATLLARTAFSRIVVAASNQQGESSYRRVDKSDIPGRVIDLFAEALRDVSAGAREFRDAMQLADNGRSRNLESSDSTGTVLSWGHQTCQLLLRDARTPIVMADSTSSVAVVVSSPPYLMSWDYGLYHKFRFYWLGFDLDSYEDTEIGRHLRRQGDDVDRYRADMVAVFRALDAVVAPTGYIVLVNAPAIVYGREVNTNVILEDCARVAGWQMIDCVSSIAIPGPHHGMYASLSARGAAAPGRSGKREHVLVFNRG
jgi:hypothetical protein